MIKEPASTLTQIEQVHQLTAEEASRGFPVSLQGVVTYHNHPETLFIQDSTAGIYAVEDSSATDSLNPGDLVRLSGVTGPGDFAPVIHVKGIEVVRSVQMPQPRKVSFEQLITGSEDSQWVELRGIVRAVTVNPRTGLPEFRIASGGGQVRTEIFDQPPRNLAQFVDATVRARGAVGGIFNQKRQLVAAKLFVPGMVNVFVDEPAPADPFAVPTHAIMSLLQYSTQGAYGHRVKVRGQVSFHQPGRTLFIRDATQGLSVQTQQMPQLSIGDEVEVLGFAAVGEWMPILQDGVFRKIAAGSPPGAVAVTAQEALDGNYDTDLVRIEARLLERVRRPDAEVLVMQSDDLIFNAQLEGASSENSLGWLRNGSLLQLTGICLVQVGGPAKSRQAFHLLLRIPGDVRVIENPSWWNMARILWALGTMTTVCLLAMVWVAVLRRRVRSQTDIIRQNVQRESMLEERTRIAREFHDTLEQELVGITMQLDTVAAKWNQSPAAALPYLDLARQMSRRSLTEARRSVWDLRCHALETGDLATALAQIARPIMADSGVHLHYEELGNRSRLPRLIENNLLRIGQEAITNTVKHAGAKNLYVQIRFHEREVRLCIRDDGRGFVSQGIPPENDAHFGLLGMHERAGKMRGKLSLRSAPGEGTEILVEVPVDMKNGEHQAAGVHDEKK